MMEAFFGFKKTPFGDHPDGKQLFPSQAYTEAKTRLQFLADHHGAGLLTGEVGSGKSTAARGVPVKLYIDNAKIYRSQQLARIAASLGILIVHTPPYQP
jgi:general secretion pathway protein A